MSEGPDLLSIGSGGKLASVPAAVVAGDPAIWTILGEAGGDPEGQRAVASVIANRADRRGAHPGDIVGDPAEGFEAWQAHQSDLRKRYPPGSPQYEAARSRVAGILNGETVAPYPYDSFYSPTAQKALGRQPPNFEDGTGIDLGGNRFFQGAYHLPARPSLEAIAGKKAITEVTPSGDTVASDTKQVFTPEQQKTYRMLTLGQLIDPKKPPGDVERPWMQRKAEDTFAPGQFYVALDGQIRQSPGAPSDGGYGKGFAEAPNDMLASFAKIVPFADDSTIGNAARGNALIYNARYAADPKSMIGRLGGTLATATPFMLAGGEGAAMTASALGDAAPVLAPALRFLGGAGSTFKANPLIWTASKAVQGAEHGALGGALTSGQYDRPAIDTIRQDAQAGAIIGPLIPGIGGIVKGIGGGVRGVAEPFTEAGRNKLVDRFLLDQARGGPTATDLSEIVPGSRPTLAQATGNPGIARVERQAQLLNPTPFSALARSNQQARELAVDAARGDKQSLDDLISARSNQTDPLREAAFAHTTPVDAAPAIKVIDDVLASPSGQRDAVKTALTSIRDKLVGQTDPAQLWGIRQAIGDMLSPLSAGTKSDGRLASRELMGVRDALDPVIEGGAPGFQGYLAEYSKASKEIGAQQFLQGLNFTTSDGTITLGKVSNALNRIEAMRAKGGANPAKDISATTLKNLYSLRDDLVRQARDQIGRGTGSDTVQKLATNKLVETLGIPTALGVGLHNPFAGAAVGLTKMALASKNQQLLSLLTGKLVDPTLAPDLAPAATPIANRLLPTLARKAVRPATIVGTNQLLAAPSS